jgi:hypothetical protein
MITSPPKPWRTWQKVLAYAILAALAAGSIWLIDRRVPRMPDGDPSGRETAPEVGWHRDIETALPS